MIERSDDLSRGDDGVSRFLWARGMSAPALYANFYFGTIGCEYAFARAHSARWTRGIEVKTEQATDVFERTKGDHVFGTAIGFFSRLKDGTPVDRPRQYLLACQKAQNCTEYGGGMTIVSAGVHHARYAAAVGRVFGILYAKCVDIGSHADARVFQCVVGDNATTSGTRLHMASGLL